MIFRVLTFTDKTFDIKSSLHTIRLYIRTSETYKVRTLFFLMFCQYVCVKSFCKKNKEFKTALMTSFILLLSKKCK